MLHNITNLFSLVSGILSKQLREMRQQGIHCVLLQPSCTCNNVSIEFQSQSCVDCDMSKNSVHLTSLISFQEIKIKKKLVILSSENWFHQLLITRKLFMNDIKRYYQLLYFLRLYKQWNHNVYWGHKLVKSTVTF